MAAPARRLDATATRRGTFLLSFFCALVSFAACADVLGIDDRELIDRPDAAGPGGTGGIGGMSSSVSSGGAGGQGGSGGTAGAGGQAGSGGAGGGGECSVDADCTGPTLSVCDPLTKTCVECVAGPADTCPFGSYCDGGTNTCAVGCDDDADCNPGGTGPLVCNTTTNTCTGCSTQDPCPPGTTCNMGACNPSCDPLNQASCPQAWDCCTDLCKNLSLDEDNCGGCGVSCALAGSIRKCLDGTCLLVGCETGYGDCDSNPGNGCETSLDVSVLHCGMCGNACMPQQGGTPYCKDGMCGESMCTAPLADCNGDPMDGCEVDVSTDMANCGVCGTACEYPNGTADCLGGQCQLTGCSGGFGNCDGNFVNGCETNTQTNVLHCNGCGMECNLPNATEVCSGGSCQVAGCMTGFGNCDTDMMTGCETPLTTLTDCGACGAVCSLPNGVVSCGMGTCQLDGCVNGFDNCDNSPTTGCEADLNSIQNCGACAVVCMNQNGTTMCSAGQCAPSCALGFDDCDMNPNNGCETSLKTLMDCGACGAGCDLSNATESCATGTCMLVACENGFGDCDGNPNNGCETSLTSLQHCGACGNACTNPNGTTSCNGMSCVPICDTGFGNCDGNPSNGCETNTQINAQNCGNCGNACMNGYVCTSSTCMAPTCSPGTGECDGIPATICETNTTNNVMHCGGCGNACFVQNGTPACIGSMCQVQSCNMGFANCNGMYMDGCEVNTNTNVQNCGGCNQPCNGTNGTPSCSGGTCSIVCNLGWGNCDMDAGTGCETNLQTTVNHCGGCGNACTNPHGTTACSGGQCVPNCAAGWSDCDGNPGNGCETDLNTLGNCGGCGFMCNLPNATPSCINQQCAIQSCNTNFANCDGQAANGCEVNKQTDINNCGGCNTACSNPNGTTTCMGGLCTPSCSTGYASCDGNNNNGCETNTNTSITHCGGCNKPCNSINGTASCASGSCSFICDFGWGDCDNNGSNGCETNLQTSNGHCGACGNACMQVNGTNSCQLGGCVPMCNPGYENCDGFSPEGNANGCEVNLNSPQNCGGCGISCTNLPNSTSVCMNQQCILTCNTNYADCNMWFMDGCEAYLATDLNNCGGCGLSCTNPGGPVSCAGGMCMFSCTAPGWEDCDGDSYNGCEADLNNDADNCGTCTKMCAFPNAIPYCTGGNCDIQTCNPFWGDCDGMLGNGCETDTSMDVNHCGFCSNMCTNNGGSTSCMFGTCQPECTKPGFDDCNMDTTDGCETDTSSDPDNCGMCGNICMTIPMLCAGGICL